MADATDDGGLRGSLSPETLAFYEDAFGTMDPIDGQVAPQQFLDLIKIVGVDANIDTAAKVVNDCGGLDFDSFLELVQDCDSSSVTAFRRSFRDTVTNRIKDIEGREAAARAHEQRIDEAVSFVKAAKLSQATLDHLNRKYDELLEHGSPVGVEEIAKGLRDEGDLVEEQARRDAWILVEQASLDDDKSTVCREAFLRQCADRKEGWQYWWRGDRIQRDDRGFSAGGGLGLLNDIADAGWRIKNERLANKWREDDRNELRPEFQRGLANLKDKVYAQTRAKSVNGRALSGAMLATLAKTYADALNAGGVPTISTAWDRVLQSQAAEAVGKCLEDYDKSACSTHELPDASVLSAKSYDEDAISTIVSQSKLPLSNDEVRKAHQDRVLKSEKKYAKAVWADSSQNPEQDQLSALDDALDSRLKRVLDLNRAASQQQCDELADSISKQFESDMSKLIQTPGRSAKGASYGEVVREETLQDRNAFMKDLDARKAFLRTWRPSAEKASKQYFKEARGPCSGDVYCSIVAPRLLATISTWATTLGVEHRAVQKLARADASKAEEQAQAARGRLAASKTAAVRERDALDRAADAAELEGKGALTALERLADSRRSELARHEAASKRLEEAYQYASSCLDGQADAVNSIGEQAKEGLTTVRTKSRAAIEDSANAASENDAAEAWDAHDLGFERDELAEFAPLRLDALRDRIAEDEKELELMHEHAALTIEHAKVKKMLLADKDHELREYEYQWGVAKANVAASEGELMVVEEEVAVLRGLVLQMHKHLADASRSGRFPADVARGLPRDQKALLEQLLDGR